MSKKDDNYIEWLKAEYLLEKTLLVFEEDYKLITFEEMLTDPGKLTTLAQITSCWTQELFVVHYILKYSSHVGQENWNGILCM